MADQKLHELTAATPATGDLLYLVDVSDTSEDAAGSSRRATVADILALAPVLSVAGKTGAVTLTSADVGADPSGTAAAAAAAHLAASNPHAQYALSSGLAAVATSGAYADLSGRPTIGTAAALDVPAAGNAAAGEVVKGSDTRLTDSRTPTAHTQAWATITSTPTTLSGYGITDAATATHTHTASQISDSTTAGRAILTAADAAAQRVAVGLSTIARGVFVSTPADGTVVIEAKAAFAFTLSQIRGLKTSTGSLTLAVQINGTNVTGLTGLTVTTSAQDATASGANAVAVGDRVTVVISSSSGPANLEFTLSAAR